MKIDFNGAPRTQELVRKHEAETFALERNPDPLTLAMHCQRQVIELLELCVELERGTVNNGSH